MCQQESGKILLSSLLMVVQLVICYLRNGWALSITMTMPSVVYWSKYIPLLSKLLRNESIPSCIVMVAVYEMYHSFGLDGCFRLISISLKHSSIFCLVLVCLWKDNFLIPHNSWISHLDSSCLVRIELVVLNFSYFTSFHGFNCNHARPLFLIGPFHFQ